MPKIFHKRSGSWTEVKSVFHKRNGAWTEVLNVFRKTSGSWVKVFAAAKIPGNTVPPTITGNGYLYGTLTNTRLDIFQDMTSIRQDDFLSMFKDLFGQDLRKNDPEQKGLEQVRNKFYNYAAKYKDNPVKFFEDEFENFNYTANKVLKRLSKIYALAQDDEQPVSESILNWELYQKVKEQKEGKQKFSTKIKSFK